MAKQKTSAEPAATTTSDMSGRAAMKARPRPAVDRWWMVSTMAGVSIERASTKAQATQGKDNVAHRHVFAFDSAAAAVRNQKTYADRHGYPVIHNAAAEAEAEANPEKMTVPAVLQKYAAGVVVK